MQQGVEKIITLINAEFRADLTRKRNLKKFI